MRLSSLASTSDIGVKANNTSFQESLSADGTRVAFYSHATNLDPLDVDIIADIYVKDLSTGDIVLASEEAYFVMPELLSRVSSRRYQVSPAIRAVRCTRARQSASMRSRQ